MSCTQSQIPHILKSALNYTHKIQDPHSCAKPLYISCLQKSLLNSVINLESKKYITVYSQGTKIQEVQKKTNSGQEIDKAWRK